MGYNNLKLITNLDNIVKFRYDQPREITGRNGVFYSYGLIKDDEEVYLAASGELHDKLSQYTAGDVVNVRKEEDANGDIRFNIIPQEGTPPRTPNNSMGAPTATTVEKREYFESKDEARQKDIHRQVAFKEACKHKTQLTDDELDTIQGNMKNLLAVLEGKDRLPF